MEKQTKKKRTTVKGSGISRENLEKKISELEAQFAAIFSLPSSSIIDPDIDQDSFIEWFTTNELVLPEPWPSKTKLKEHYVALRDFQKKEQGLSGKPQHCDTCHNWIPKGTAHANCSPCSDLFSCPTRFIDKHEEWAEKYKTQQENYQTWLLHNTKFKNLKKKSLHKRTHFDITTSNVKENDLGFIAFEEKLSSLGSASQADEEAERAVFRAAKRKRVDTQDLPLPPPVAVVPPPPVKLLAQEIPELEQKLIELQEEISVKKEIRFAIYHDTLPSVVRRFPKYKELILREFSAMDPENPPDFEGPQTQESTWHYSPDQTAPSPQRSWRQTSYEEELDKPLFKKNKTSQDCSAAVEKVPECQQPDIEIVPQKVIDLRSSLCIVEVSMVEVLKCSAEDVNN